MSETRLVFQLEARVDEGKRLIVSAEVDGNRIESPGLRLKDFTVTAPDATAVTLRVNDFYQNDTVYKVYGFVLANDGADIADYWRDTRTGIEYTFAAPRPGEGEAPIFIIGARPANPTVPEPTPSIPGDGLPASGDGKQGSGGGGK